MFGLRLTCVKLLQACGFENPHPNCAGFGNPAQQDFKEENLRISHKSLTLQQER